MVSRITPLQGAHLIKYFTRRIHLDRGTNSFLNRDIIAGTQELKDKFNPERLQTTLKENKRLREDSNLIADKIDSSKKQIGFTKAILALPDASKTHEILHQAMRKGVMPDVVMYGAVLNR